MRRCARLNVHVIGVLKESRNKIGGIMETNNSSRLIEIQL